MSFLIVPQPGQELIRQINTESQKPAIGGNLTRPAAKINPEKQVDLTKEQHPSKRHRKTNLS